MGIYLEATKFTEVGYVGRDVESMVRELADKAVAMVHEEQLEVKKEQAKVNAENRILDILIPPVLKSPSFETDIESNEEVENKETREKFRAMLKNGVLDEREIEIEITDAGPSFITVLPRVTCPSDPRATFPSFITPITVVDFILSFI